MQKLHRFKLTKIEKYPVSNIFNECELERDSICKESLLTVADGKAYKNIFYNPDVIISVGYRVKSKRDTQFRIRANNILKEYLFKGYVVNHRIFCLIKSFIVISYMFQNGTYGIIGASLKDLAKKGFAFSKIGLDAAEIIRRIENKNN